MFIFLLRLKNSISLWNVCLVYVAYLPTTFKKNGIRRLRFRCLLLRSFGAFLAQGGNTSDFLFQILKVKVWLRKSLVLPSCGQGAKLVKKISFRRVKLAEYVILA